MRISTLTRNKNCTIKRHHRPVVRQKHADRRTKRKRKKKNKFACKHGI